MIPRNAYRSRIPFFVAAVAAFVSLFPSPSHAISNRTIVLRATGSGALLGVGAGLISYPFAKSTGTIFAGALVGAILGTIYGFHLVDVRDENYRQTALEDLEAMNGERTARLLRSSPAAEASVPLAVFRF